MMNETLHRYGYTVFYECKLCGGAKKHYNNRSKPGYEIVISLRTNTFSIFKNNMLVEGPVAAASLEEKLINL